MPRVVGELRLGYSDDDESTRVSNEGVLFPTVNADGLPIVPCSDVHKFLFDTRGWLLLPGLLSEEELVPIRDHQLKNKYEPESLPPDQRDTHGGPSQVRPARGVTAGPHPAERSDSRRR